MKSNTESESHDSEDEAQETIDPNQSIVVSTLAQPENQDSEDEIDDATVLLFEETLTKHLASKTEGGGGGGGNEIEMERISDRLQ